MLILIFFLANQEFQDNWTFHCKASRTFSIKLFFQACYQRSISWSAVIFNNYKGVIIIKRLLNNNILILLFIIDFFQNKWAEIIIDFKRIVYISFLSYLLRLVLVSIFLIDAIMMLLLALSEFIDKQLTKIIWRIWRTWRLQVILTLIAMHKTNSLIGQADKHSYL